MLAILFGVGVFLVAFAQLSKRYTSHAFVKALIAGVVGWLASGLFFTLGKIAIALAFIALVVAAVVLLVQGIHSTTGES